MWILECDGDVLGGGFAIENKSISRKHLTIEVAPVKLGDGSKLHTKSRLTISDLESKFGTQLDGEQIRGESRVLSNDGHEIKLGSYENSFRQEQKNRDPLEPMRTRLEPLDIKTIIPYVIEKTTHVVATKRNTAKGLQALINARYVVTDTFVDALVLAATPELPEDPESLSSLEVDFDKNWPDALDHLPTQGKEPSQRPSSFFAPDPKRANIFEGYTFVFCDNVQYENLHSPIANGGGKALLFELRMGETTAEEVVQYVKNAAGDKGNGNFDTRSGGKGVVVVRFRGRKGMEQWSIELGNEVARKLDQRLIEQSEFLDAILINDASGLRKALLEDDDDGQLGSSTLAASMPVSERPDSSGKDAPESAPQPPQTYQPTNKRIRSRFVTSRFKGFDDGFNPASLPQSSKMLEGPQMENLSESHECANDEAKLRLYGESGMDLDSQPLLASVIRESVSRKRPPPQSEDEDHDEVMNQILPAAAAMKKRRIEAEEESHHYAETQGNAGRKKGSIISQRTRDRKPRKEVDVLEAAREHKEAEEDVARRDQEALKVLLDGMEIDQMKNLALVEEVEITRRPDHHSRTRAYGDTGSRWDERWNGRKNFKKFKRRGVGDGGQARRVGSVIVGLEEVRKKDFGIGDGYWAEGDTRKKKQKESQGLGESELPSIAAAKSRPSKDNSNANEQLRVTRLTSKTSKDRDVESVDVTKPRVSSRKRGPSPTGAKPNPAKKRNGLFVKQSDSDDSEDDLKFRFRRKR